MRSWSELSIAEKRARVDEGRYFSIEIDGHEFSVVSILSTNSDDTFELEWFSETVTTPEDISKYTEPLHAAVRVLVKESISGMESLVTGGPVYDPTF